MKDYEKAIEIAARAFARELSGHDLAVLPKVMVIDGFIQGAKSEIAKEYWFEKFKQENHE